MADSKQREPNPFQAPQQVSRGKPRTTSRIGVVMLAIVLTPPSMLIGAGFGCFAGLASASFSDETDAIPGVVWLGIVLGAIAGGGVVIAIMVEVWKRMS